MKRQEPGESSLQRVIRILEVFAEGDSSMTPAEISRRTGLPPASTYRLVGEMLEHGFLDRSENGVKTGVKLWELATRESWTTKLRATSLPYLSQLRAALGHHTHLSILEGTDVLYVERLSAKEDVVNITDVATRLPAALASPGLLFAAYSNKRDQDRIFSVRLKKFSPLTPATLQEIVDTLPTVRSQGFAIVEGWIDETVAGVAAPIRSPQGDVLAAVSVLVANDGKAAMASLASVKATANRISTALKRQASMLPIH